MRKVLAVLTAVLVLCLAAGCSNDKEKGQNRDKDKPRAAANWTDLEEEDRSKRADRPSRWGAARTAKMVAAAPRPPTRSARPTPSTVQSKARTDGW